MRRRVRAGVAAGMLLAAACSGGSPDERSDNARDFALLDDLLAVDLGGETTRRTVNANAFGLPAANLAGEDRARFEVGDSLFTQNWVIAPASTDVRDGLGPTFNAAGCAGCHVLDGRAEPPGPDGEPPGLLLRLSVPGTDAHGGPVPDPTYGGQLQDRSIPGVEAEGAIEIAVKELVEAFEDGDPYSLQVPKYGIARPAFGAASAELMISPRIAPVTFGMGLLEAIPDKAILANADPDDADGDGISGRPNRVWDQVLGRTVLGRLGWKANVATVEQQVAGAFLGDIGITSRLQSVEGCPDAQAACRAAPSGGAPELRDDLLDDVVFYSRVLAVPAARDRDDPAVRRGAQRFADANCAACHVPTFTTGDSDLDVLSNQRIHPFTDLLLHDMGDGLADGRPDFAASGQEWRTPPLWGIGLVDDINGHTRFLHDGRARSLMEAILWHGGEGDASRKAVRAMSAEQRADLIAYLESL